jgi:hypothetical protein
MSGLPRVEANVPELRVSVVDDENRSTHEEAHP